MTPIRGFRSTVVLNWLRPCLILTVSIIIWHCQKLWTLQLFKRIIFSWHCQQFHSAANRFGCWCLSSRLSSTMPSTEWTNWRNNGISDCWVTQLTASSQTKCCDFTYSSSIAIVNAVQLQWSSTRSCSSTDCSWDKSSARLRFGVGQSMILNYI